MRKSGAPGQEKRSKTVMIRSIDGFAAHEIVGAAVRHAARLGIRINAAVVDPCGILIAFLRMPKN
jgi:uncharacterized protein GlcG (DUF336 family)